MREYQGGEICRYGFQLLFPMRNCAILLLFFSVIFGRAGECATDGVFASENAECLFKIGMLHFRVYRYDEFNPVVFLGLCDEFTDVFCVCFDRLVCLAPAGI